MAKSSAPEGKEETNRAEGADKFEESDEDMDYAQLYNALEEINSYLDDLEERNQALNRELSSLLESNREIRRELQNAVA